MPIGFRTRPEGDLDVRWIHGSPSARHNRDPELQVHRYDEHTVILRQNKAVHHEAPFLYLLFGNDRALLVDTGATPDPQFFPLRATVDRLLDGWLAARPRDRYQLLVLHSHGHSDHVAGDGQFAGRPDTTVVGADQKAMTGFLGLRDRPDGVAQVDLAAGRTPSPAPGTTTPRSPGTTGSPGCCSAATPSTPGACTCSTGRPTPPRWTGCWPSPPTTRSATCSAATSR